MRLRCLRIGILSLVLAATFSFLAPEAEAQRPGPSLTCSCEYCETAWPWLECYATEAQAWGDCYLYLYLYCNTQNLTVAEAPLLSALGELAARESSPMDREQPCGLAISS